MTKRKRPVTSYTCDNCGTEVQRDFAQAEVAARNAQLTLDHRHCGSAADVHCLPRNVEEAKVVLDPDTVAAADLEVERDLVQGVVSGQTGIACPEQGARITEGLIPVTTVEFEVANDPHHVLRIRLKGQDAVPSRENSHR